MREGGLLENKMNKQFYLRKKSKSKPSFESARIQNEGRRIAWE